MKKVVFTLMLFAALLSSLTVTLPIKAKAENADSISSPSGLAIYSPLNTTDSSRYLTLNLTLESAGQMGGIDPNIVMNYDIDGRFNGAVPLYVSNPGLHVVTNAAALVELPELSPGAHCLTIFLYGLNQRSLEPKYLSFEDRVYFSVSADAPDLTPEDVTPPRILILSPAENETFEVANITSLEIPLNFTVDEASQLSFSLDGQLNKTITGNNSLTGLPAGLHNVTVYAWDSAGNAGASETVSFIVAVKPESKPENVSSLVLPIAASTVSVATATTAAMIYWKKRRN